MKRDIDEKAFWMEDSMTEYSVQVKCEQAAISILVENSKLKAKSIDKEYFRFNRILFEISSKDAYTDRIESDRFHGYSLPDALFV